MNYLSLEPIIKNRRRKTQIRKRKKASFRRRKKNQRRRRNPEKNSRGIAIQRYPLENILYRIYPKKI